MEEGQDCWEIRIEKVNKNRVYKITNWDKRDGYEHQPVKENNIPLDKVQLQ